jgi:hypothetical protein
MLSAWLGFPWLQFTTPLRVRTGHTETPNRIAARRAMENRTRESHESPYGKHEALVWFVPSTKAIVIQGKVNGDLSQGQH